MGIRQILPPWGGDNRLPPMVLASLLVYFIFPKAARFVSAAFLLWWYKHSPQNNKRRNFDKGAGCMYFLKKFLQNMKLFCGIHKIREAKFDFSGMFDELAIDED